MAKTVIPYGHYFLKPVIAEPKVFNRVFDDINEAFNKLWDGAVVCVPSAPFVQVNQNGVTAPNQIVFQDSTFWPTTITDVDISFTLDKGPGSLIYANEVKGGSVTWIPPAEGFNYSLFTPTEVVVTMSADYNIVFAGEDNFTVSVDNERTFAVENAIAGNDSVRTYINGIEVNHLPIDPGNPRVVTLDVASTTIGDDIVIRYEWVVTDSKKHTTGILLVKEARDGIDADLVNKTWDGGTICLPSTSIMLLDSDNALTPNEIIFKDYTFWPKVCELNSLSFTLSGGSIGTLGTPIITADKKGSYVSWAPPVLDYGVFTTATVSVDMTVDYTVAVGVEDSFTGLTGTNIVLGLSQIIRSAARGADDIVIWINNTKHTSYTITDDFVAPEPHSIITLTDLAVAVIATDLITVEYQFDYNNVETATASTVIGRTAVPGTGTYLEVEHRTDVNAHIDDAHNAWVDGRITAMKAIANGLATLGADSKIPFSQLPALALTDVSVVATIAARDALVVQEGDVAVVTGDSSWIYDGTSWIELTSPSAGNVLSVNGKTGTVVLTTTDIGEGTNLYFTDARADARVSAVLGTWAGGTSITTLGTITTGTWNGSNIGATKITTDASNRFVSDTDKSNWNTAYGWGNHASAGYATVNNYLSGVSGSGNGTVTFTRAGLINLTWSAVHDHALTDDILDGTTLKYLPYATQQAKLSFDTSTTQPTRTDRLNVNGYLYATKLFAGTSEVSLVGHNHDGSYSTTSHLHTGVYEPVFIKNNAFNKNFGTAVDTVCQGNDARLSDSRTPLAHTLDSHSNVTITSNTSGELLKWNGTAWINNTLAEAGISATSHTHSYLPLAGGTLTGQFKVLTGGQSELLIDATTDVAYARVAQNFSSSKTLSLESKGNVNIILDSANTATGKTFTVNHNSYTAVDYLFQVNDTGNALVWGSLYAKGEVYAYYSDLRLKNITGHIDSALDKLKTLNGINFTWNEKHPNKDMVGKESIGLIAQEVEKVFPEAVGEQDGYKMVQYEKLVPVLVEAIKDQQNQIDALRNLITELTQNS
ncbi:tail fiber domain-containing protein [Acinetobacter sp.]|uniref:tail fiber domain-containing protein n=1 Tax=Acinetobacter sp. TaxID=472 RepID=UPI003D084B8C